MTVLNMQVAQCDVLRVSIVPRWIDASDAKGLHRPEQEDDFVRIKIASALGLGKRVIPMLANTAEMPRSGDLPLPLKLPGNTIALRPARFKADSQ